MSKSKKNILDNFNIVPMNPPAICANVLVIPNTREPYQGKVIGRALDGSQVVKYLLIDAGKIFSAPQWESVYDVFEVE